MPEAKQIEEDVVEVELENDTEKEVESTQVSVGEENEENTVEETSDEDLEYLARHGVAHGEHGQTLECSVRRPYTAGDRGAAVPRANPGGTIHQVLQH